MIQKQIGVILPYKTFEPEYEKRKFLFLKLEEEVEIYQNKLRKLLYHSSATVIVPDVKFNVKNGFDKETNQLSLNVLLGKLAPAILEKTDLIIGGAYTNRAEETLPIIKNENIFLLSPSATGNLLTFPDDSFFRILPVDKYEARVIAFAIENYSDRLLPNGEYAQAFDKAIIITSDIPTFTSDLLDLLNEINLPYTQFTFKTLTDDEVDPQPLRGTEISANITQALKDAEDEMSQSENEGKNYALVFDVSDSNFYRVMDEANYQNAQSVFLKTWFVSGFSTVEPITKKNIMDEVMRARIDHEINNDIFFFSPTRATDSNAEEYFQKINSWFLDNGYQEANIWDCLWVDAAWILVKSLPVFLTDLNVSNSSIVTSYYDKVAEKIMQFLSSETYAYNGLSGKIFFDNNGDRKEIDYELYLVEGTNLEDRYSDVKGIFKGSLDRVIWN